MGDCGSDTETDDELFESIQATQARTSDSQIRRDDALGLIALKDSVEAENNVQTDQEIPSRQEQVQTDAPVASAPPDQPVASPVQLPADSIPQSSLTQRRHDGFPASVLNSDDDEPPRFHPPTVPARRAVPSSCNGPFAIDSARNREEQFQSIDHSPPSMAQPAAPTPSFGIASHLLVRQENTLDARASTSAAQRATYQPHGLSSQQQAPPASTPASFPPTSDDGDFVSPFSVLAAQYRPPAPPVYGAPPVSYVPGRSVAATSTYPPLQQPPPLSSVRIPCSNCCRVLPPISSPVPVDGQATCACCRRYYAHVVTRRNDRSRRYCTTCVVPSLLAPSQGPSARGPPQAPPLSHAPRQAPAARAQPQAPISRPRVASAAQTTSCPLCSERVRVIPPNGDDRLQCQCCMLTLSRAAFGKKQKKASHPMPRCRNCIQAKPSPTKFHNIRGKNAKPVVDGSVIRLLLGPTRNSLQPALSEASVSTTEQRRQMEIEVRNFKLAKRSIYRRWTANDLRGSTRIEYETQLAEEEKKVDDKMARVRRGNPVLFDELNQGIKVKSVLVAPRDRDDGRKTKKPKATQSKPTKPVRRRADRLTNAQKRRFRGQVNDLLPPAKKARASPREATASSPSPGVAASADTNPKTEGTERTRSWTRSMPKLIEIIDLVDSD